MKVLKPLIVVLFVGALFSFTQNKKETIHTENLITWKASKVTGSHEGTISLKGGGLEYNSDGKPVGGILTMDMTSITVTDLKGNQANNLRGHLMSPDFFDVAKHPEANFVFNKIESSKDDKNNYNVTGDLTIKGITKSIDFPASIKKEGGHMVAKAKIKVDRTAYDVKYGSGKFFENLGDRMIDDHFELNVTLIK